MHSGLWALMRAEKGWGGASSLSRGRGESQQEPGETVISTVISLPSSPLRPPGVLYSLGKHHCGPEFYVIINHQSTGWLRLSSYLQSHQDSSPPGA